MYIVVWKSINNTKNYTQESYAITATECNIVHLKTCESSKNKYNNFWVIELEDNIMQEIDYDSIAKYEWKQSPTESLYYKNWR